MPITVLLTLILYSFYAPFNFGTQLEVIVEDNWYKFLFLNDGRWQIMIIFALFLSIHLKFSSYYL